MRIISKKLLFVFVALFLLILILPVRAGRVVYNSNFHAGKKIAITFDDGPHPKKTKRILEVLDKYSVKATFFVIGENVKNYPNELEKIYEKGHEIGNHTYSHSLLKSMSEEKIQEEISNTESQVKKICDCNMNLVRPPCGIYDETLEKIAEKSNFKIILWTVDTHDWAHASSQNMIKNVLKNIKDGDIVLFHDYVSGEYNTPEALDILIPLLLEKGYEFVTVSELLQ